MSGLVCVAIAVFAASAYMDARHESVQTTGPLRPLVTHIVTATAAVPAGVYFAGVFPLSALSLIVANPSPTGLASQAPPSLSSALRFISSVYELRTASSAGSANTACG